MPTYQYACKECGERLEVIQKFADEPLTECPACHGRLRKLFSPVGVVFKGSGFYKTDSRAPATSSAKSSSDSSSSKDSSDTSGSKESKDSSGSKESKDSSASSGDAATSGTSSSADGKSSSKVA